VFLLMATACQLQFCRALFQVHSRSSWLNRAAHAVSLFSVFTAMGFVLFSQYWTQLYFATLFWLGNAIVVTSWLVYRAWRLGNRLALVWIIAFIPLFMTLGAAFADGLGFFEDELGYTLPLYASAVEVIFLGLALQSFAQDRRAQIEREKTLAAADPLTGFITQDAFQHRLIKEWNSENAQQQDLAVVYIELQTQARNSKHREQLLRRSVRVLRSATQADDVVARLEGQLLAILMPHTPMGDDLNQRLSRIVALGLMPDRSDQQSPVLQFRIAATTWKHFDQPVNKLDDRLRALLADTQSWSRKPIRYIGQTARERARWLDESRLEDAWSQAYAKQLEDEVKPAPSAQT
jgi:GGDEF domain-containing protein